MSSSKYIRTIMLLFLLYLHLSCSDPVTVEQHAGVLLVADPGAYADAIQDYLTGLGYDVTVTDEYPQDSGMDSYVFVVCGDDDISGADQVMEAYLASGGSVILQGGQPYALGMPDWIGMNSYSNWFGSNTYNKASFNNPLETPGVNQDDPFFFRDNYMDGGAVLQDPSSAIIDGHFNNDVGSASQIHNQYGNGRIAWTTCWLCPWDAGSDGYTTDEYESYLVTVYAWLASE